LLVHQFKNNTILPTLTHNQDELKKYQGWHILYSKQCPWVVRFIEEVKPIFIKEKIVVSIQEIETADQAQKAPSLYGVFNLIYNGKLLADRYISTSRLLNIVKKEVKSLSIE